MTLSCLHISGLLLNGAIKGPGRAEPRVVLTLPSKYIGLGLGEPKPFKGLYHLSPYPTFKGLKA